MQRPVCKGNAEKLGMFFNSVQVSVVELELFSNSVQVIAEERGLVSNSMLVQLSLDYF